MILDVRLFEFYASSEAELVGNIEIQIGFYKNDYTRLTNR
jgi:hypothetical protein